MSSRSFRRYQTSKWSFQPTSPLETCRACVRRSIGRRKRTQSGPKFQDYPFLYLNPQSAGTRAICALSAHFAAHFDALSMNLHVIENMIASGFSLDSCDVYVLSYLENHPSDLSPDLSILQLRHGDIIFRARASLLLRLLLQRHLKSYSPERKFEDSSVEGLIQRLLTRLPENCEDQEPSILAFTPATREDTSVVSVLHLPALSQQHVEIQGWPTSELQYNTKLSRRGVGFINGARIPDYFDSIVDICEAVPLQYFQE